MGGFATAVFYGFISKSFENNSILEEYFSTADVEDIEIEEPYESDTVCIGKSLNSEGYRELPRKPRGLAPRMNWQNNLKNT